MRPADLALLLLYALGMSIGQLMFKAASNAFARQGLPFSPAGVMMNPWLLGGVLLYAVLTLLWVVVLTRIPLSHAYPFVALSFIFTPLGAALVFGEVLTLNYALGIALILSGLIVVGTGSG
jgi:drug/metabolite transporter (DMT)-like permease